MKRCFSYSCSDYLSPDIFLLYSSCVGVNYNSFQDATGHEFATRLGNVFTIGKGTKPWVSLPKGKGIKLTVIEEARKRAAAAQQAVAA